MTITINVFRDHHGSGPWLNVWHGVDVQAVAGEDGALPKDAEKEITLAIQIERELRDSFISLAQQDYKRAVEALRVPVESCMAEHAVQIEILDHSAAH